jgi:hypothetical protein
MIIRKTPEAARSLAFSILGVERMRRHVESSESAYQIKPDSSRCRFQRLQKLIRGESGRSLRKELFGQTCMHLGIQIGAAVLHNEEPVIGIACVQ